ncbi:hypothetical protein Pst134EA_031564 [Puccinia striiformis f. sp. tritici]|uniref:uncharacterized protein n=1 Tax=Puccinia striiformis f. sp. tritici TaxID=168172 RepID=UPI0020086C6E|nr:uncharacterized protein Pst134EA_031564 [Puccinia striiformis f. sp. tritici]KAH9442747.1 hypothetical protein Pst134EA_031564 [Puccinia striiformis f. sp. tritici]
MAGMGFSSRATFAILFFLAGLVSGNWDPSTGHLNNHRPTAAWLARHKASVSSNGIQVSECSINTRLHFPNVNSFAWFEVNHVWDGNHGCPYGTCHAYVAHPAPSEMEPSFTHGHSFFWHRTGGLQGSGVKPISNPTNGGYGYESSISGKFIDGAPDTTSRQLSHDSNYPGFDPKKLQVWSPAAINAFKGSEQTIQHPKCGRPCEHNKDPGSAPGAYGGYKPSPGIAYKPPRGWKPSQADACFHAHGNHTPPQPHHPQSSTQNPNSKNKSPSTIRPENEKAESSKSAHPSSNKGKKSSNKVRRLRLRMS